ncbi:MAG: hypothetical protein M3275_00685 [Thermoproteota archaeon]|nr:hypothetical protein [Thermoproteota archaeon]MDQ3966893.1 hypothetical protein [Thermoproteota archaeon]
MQQIKLISKLGLAVIALSVAVAVYTFSYYYFIQPADAQAQVLPNVPDNSVTSAKIVDGEVKSVDIGDRQVKSGDIAHGAIEVLTLFQPAQTFPPNPIPVGGDGVSQAFCSGETDVTGGGYEVLSGTLEIRENRPIRTMQGDAWQVTAHNSGLTEGEVRAWVVCAAEFP